MPLTRGPSFQLAVLALLALALSMAAAADAAFQAQNPAEPQATTTDPWVKRKTVYINTVHGKVPLRFPRLKPVPVGYASGFRRTWADTCGLFDIVHAVTAPASSGPPPHMHYNDDEWFIVVGSGKVRVFSSQKKRQFLPGELPGYNLPVPAIGSAVISTGDVLFSPRGSLHYYARETDTTDFFAIHTNGFAMETVFGFFDGTDPTYKNVTGAHELLANTGLYGSPHDITAKLAGATNHWSS